MSGASIYDLLHEYEAPVVEEEEVAPQNLTYQADRLYLISGIALTAAGSVAMGKMPKQAVSELSPDLKDAGGQRLPVYGVKKAMSVESLATQGVEDKAQRLHELVQTLMHDVMLLLSDLPQGNGCDIVLSAPLHSTEAQRLILEHIRSAMIKGGLEACLGDIRHVASGWDPHAVLETGEEGGQPYVLWLSVDSLLNRAGVAALRQRGILRSPEQPTGVCPGEAAVALLIRRMPEEEDVDLKGWQLDRAQVMERPPRPKGRNSKATGSGDLDKLLELLWPEDKVPEGPSWVVVDALRTADSSQEVSNSLSERWPGLHIVTGGLSVANWCGWPGEALTALQLILAMADLPAEDSALVLNVCEDKLARALVLQTCAQPPEPEQETAGTAGKEN
ncbi:hypothetical protein [Halomonas binhaiensis]|uniref:Uncharacterized protein n=1 Tax=Halomonas binhaiensis TaxID=2562282 RepID=A0A5C1NIF6_9GAMM|nr:hypothetical protein [Halomonas binhaiensis]QEM81529.1 hypothetical protein E4T21_08215 [Halomonas binhaiensis]